MNLADSALISQYCDSFCLSIPRYTLRRKQSLGDTGRTSVFVWNFAQLRLYIVVLIQLSESIQQALLVFPLVLALMKGKWLFIFPTVDEGYKMVNHDVKFTGLWLSSVHAFIPSTVLVPNKQEPELDLGNISGKCLQHRYNLVSLQCHHAPHGVPVCTCRCLKSFHRDLPRVRGS